jgi:D-alanyl-D-alanine carboxypeptidase
MAPRVILAVAACLALTVLALLAVQHSATQTEAEERAFAPGCGARGAGSKLASAMPFRDAAAPDAPPVSARALAVVDGETGRLLHGVNAQERRAPASTTKIMTAVLALEHASLDTWVHSEIDATLMEGSSVMGLRPGVYIRMRGRTSTARCATSWKR